MTAAGTALCLTLMTGMVFSSVAMAEESSERQIRDRIAVVKVEFATVRSGPAEAYTSKGRLYRGDQVTVRGEPGAAWVEVVAGEIPGWVNLKTLRIVPFETIRKNARGAVDQGRDRRETNYRYDKQGRRLTSDGRPMGSGEGTDAPTENMQVEVGTSANVTLSLGVGVALIDRQFFTNTTVDSLLYAVMASPLGMASQVSAAWQGAPWWNLRVDLSDARLGSTRFTEQNLNEGLPVEIESDHQTLFVGSQLTYGFGLFSLGAHLGLDMFRIGFQQPSPSQFC